MTSKFPDLPPLGIHQSIVRLACSACGAEANASCNCGKPYVPAGQRAAEAIAAHPEKSDRMIAAEIGTSPTTVGKARASTVHTGQLDEPRTGKDGKTRRLPRYIPDDDKAPAGDPNADADLIDQIITLFDQLTGDGQVRCALQLRKMAFGDV
jgi:hypothetical protein